MNTKRKNILLEKHNRLAPIEGNQLKVKLTSGSSEVERANDGPPSEAVLPLVL